MNKTQCTIFTCIPGPRKRNIDSLWLGQESNGSTSVESHSRNYNNVLLTTLKPINWLHFYSKVITVTILASKFFLNCLYLSTVRWDYANAQLLFWVIPICILWITMDIIRRFNRSMFGICSSWNNSCHLYNDFII